MNYGSLKLLLPVLAFRPIRKLLGFSPDHVFGASYATLLASVKKRLATSGQAVPADFDDDDQVVTHWYSMDTVDPQLDYRSLNLLLRTGVHPNSPRLFTLAAYLVEALLKLLPQKRFAYRVIYDFPDFSKMYQLGKVVTEQGFLSSSRNPRIPFPGQIYFTIQANTGRFIGGLSYFLTEDEILFLPFTRFKIVEIENLADGTIHVMMDELI